MGCGALAVVAVILGNYQDIRQFHDAPLDALEIVPGSGDEQEHENVHHGAYRSFRLADPHGFNENNVKARGFACNHGFTRFRATPPKEPPEGEGRMKAFSSPESSSMRVLSPIMEPRETEEDGSIASTATLNPFCIGKCRRLQ